jgi:two-component system LytT family sensor kinase
VAPMVLVTLVENVFKHGNLQDKDHPAALTCTIHENEQSMIFTTCNKKKRGAKGNNTGVGLSNTLQRLQTLYKGKCSMVVNETEEEYRVALTMPFFEYARPNQVYNLSANYKA